MNFDSLKIKPELLKAINDARYSEMTEIQQQVIPEILNNNDILGQAPTGTGKTCAFVLPSLERIDNQNKLPQVLVLSPTRELALQTIEEYKKLSKYLQNINSIAIYGGQDIKKQLNNLKRNLPQIIVATPGRLLDHIKRRSINLNNISTVVLDEADEMLNMGFIKDITSILSFIKNKHQTILLSATMPKEIIEISKRFQQPNPYKCKVQLNEKDLPEIKQYYIRVNEWDKIKIIAKLIKENNFYLTIIFTNQKHKAKWLAQTLRKEKFVTDSLHGNLKQNARDRVMKTFRNKELQVLVATDIAARGIDVKGVDAVINYDVPKDMEYYIHRIGRTARAKMTGNAYTLISNDINGNVRKIERCINEKIKEYKFNDYFPEKSERPILNREQHHDHQPRKIHFDNNKDSVRFFITIGNKDKFDNKSLRNTLVKNIGIPNDDIIDVYTKDTYSFIEVKKNSVDKITNLKQLNGRQIKVKVADQRNKNNSPSNHKPFHKNNHRFNHHHKPHFSKFRKNNSSY